MKKVREVNDPTSCWNKAEPYELCFILLGRDAAAPAAIREWVRKRIKLGLNSTGDSQTTEALDCARKMEAERDLPA